MAHIEEIENKKGTAFRVHYSINGRPLKQYFPAGTPKNAIKAFIADIENKKLKSKINNNAAGIELVGASTLNLAEFKEKYIKSRQHEILIDRQVLTFKILIKYFSPQILISRIDHNRINAWKNDLLDSKLKKYQDITWEQEQRARRGTNREYANARNIFTWAYKNDLIPRNPFDKTKPLAASEAMLRIPTRDEERRFYRELKSWQAKLSYWIMRLQGLRRSEVRSLKHKHIDLDQEAITIEKQKNKKADILPMHPILVQIIKGFKRKYNISGAPDEFIFDYNRDYLTNTFRRAFIRAGLEDIKSPVHIIRHAFVTNVLRETGDIALTRDMARHSDYNTTKRYLHLVPEDHREKFKHIKMGKSSKKVPKS